MLEIIPGGILVDGFLQVSFQRFPCPPSGVVETPPRSWGALPVARAADHELLLPVDRGEAVWIGVHVVQAEAAPSAACLEIRAELAAGRGVDVLSGAAGDSAGTEPPAMGFLVPPTASIEGIAQSAGRWRAIAAPQAPGDEAGVHRLRFSAVPSRAVQGPAAPDDHRPLHSLENAHAPAAPRVATCDSKAGPQQWDAARRVVFTVMLMSGRAFAEASGLPAPDPLDETHVYGGWRLPP